MLEKSIKPISPDAAAIRGSIRSRHSSFASSYHPEDEGTCYLIIRFISNLLIDQVYLLTLAILMVCFLFTLVINFHVNRHIVRAILIGRFTCFTYFSPSSAPLSRPQFYKFGPSQAKFSWWINCQTLPSPFITSFTYSNWRLNDLIFSAVEYNVYILDGVRSLGPGLFPLYLSESQGSKLQCRVPARRIWHYSRHHSIHLRYVDLGNFSFLQF